MTLLEDYVEIIQKIRNYVYLQTEYFVDAFTNIITNITEKSVLSWPTKSIEIEYSCETLFLQIKMLYHLRVHFKDFYVIIL
jgi:hypothetical protein